MSRGVPCFVMRGLVPRIHVFVHTLFWTKDVDGRDGARP